jgi:hypothetical protein
MAMISQAFRLWVKVAKTSIVLLPRSGTVNHKVVQQMDVLPKDIPNVQGI